MNLNDLMPLYVLQWSASQQHFHIEQVEDMLKTNYQAYFGNLPVDYIAIAFTNTHEEAVEHAKTLENKLATLKEKHRPQ